MCGICGIAGKKIDSYKQTKTIEKMNACLEHRGPDEKDSATFSGCVLGQTRLAIIDLSPSGHQPMKDNELANTVVFNGEIYNYKELRADLEKKSHVFASTSDTEVILKAYAEYGTECPKHLDGMFAFAIWDEKKQSLFMARDRFGKKPLYYAFDQDKNLIFGSEIKAILKTSVKGIIDHGAIDAYLRLLYIPPWRSIYSNIFPLKPAHSALYKDREFKTERYWRLEHKPIDIGYAEAKEKVRSLLMDAVKKRLIADVEIGSLLSGGVDSSLVTAIAQKLLDESSVDSPTPRKIKTFSAGFEGFINELPFAEETAQILKTDHYSKQVKDDVASTFKKVVASFDEPFADSSSIPTYLISKQAREKVKVVLSGDGGDEIFIGYGWYWKHWNLQKHKRALQMIWSSPFKDHLKNVEQTNEKVRIELWKDSARPTKKDAEFLNMDDLGSDFRSLNDIEQINRYDLTTYMPGDILTKVDRASMMASLEVRSPFLDHHLAEFVYNLPMSFKTDKHKGKIILKDLLSEILPDRLVNRRKQGFNAPIKNWLMRDDFKKLVQDDFITSEARIYSFFNKEKALEIVNRFYNANTDAERHATAHPVWILLVLEEWHKSHIQ